jgi:hypothetical protein
MATLTKLTYREATRAALRERDDDFGQRSRQRPAERLNAWPDGVASSLRG